MSTQSAKPGLEIRKAILAEVDARRGEAIQLLSDLVRFPSVNHPPSGDELACQQFVEKTMHAMGLTVDVFTPDEIPNISKHPGWGTGLDYTTPPRPNVVGIRKGAGEGRSLLLLAHADVVPEGPHELWRHGPFNPTVEGNELIGRGTNDDKGGLAALIMALRCIEGAGCRVDGDLILVSAADEESGGANGTLAVLLRGHVADAAVYCDGVNLEIGIANLGGAFSQLKLQIRPEVPLNAINRIAEISHEVYHDMLAYGRERTAKLRADPRYANTVWPDMAVRVGYLMAGSPDVSNPGAARMDTAFYFLPGEDPKRIQAEAEARIRVVTDRHSKWIQPPVFEWLGRLMPPSAIPQDHPFVEHVAAAYQEAKGAPAVVTGMPMSDLFQFNLHSPRPMPTVAMGPGRWDVPGGAHQPNESILIDGDLIPFIKTLALLIVDWCGIVSSKR